MSDTGKRRSGDHGSKAGTPGELERLRVVFDLVGDAVLVLDAEGRFVEVNRTACERYGYARDELRRMHIVELDAPEDRRFAAERIRKGIAEGGAVFEAVHQSKDGRRIPTEVNTRLIHLGERSYFVSVCRDLTERRRAEKAVKEAEEQLRRADQYEAVVRLAGGVAHNINNLMTVVTGYADILQDLLPADAPGRAAVDKVRVAGIRAAGIARQLTSYSRRQFIVPRIADLGGVIAEMAEALTAVAGSGIALSLEPTASPLVVEIDTEQFAGVLKELVSNARDASIPGEGKIAVRWRRADVAGGTATSTGAAVRPGAYALVEVADTGCGIDPALLPNIFDPFVTTREFGRGLGLPSVYGFVKQSDGFISIASSPRSGTTVSLYFPIAGAAAPSSGEGPKAASPKGGRRR